MSVVSIGDLSLHYVEYGGGDECILFVHGNWCSSRCWLPTMARMPGEMRTIALDQRGFGQSSKPADGYTLPQRVADLRAFADALGLERFHLVGHSLGGAVAAQFVLDNPQRVRSLFLLACPSPSGMAFSPEARAYQDRFAADRATLEPALAVAFGLATSDPFFQRLLDDAFGMARPSVQANLDTLASWQVAERLATLHVPTTIAWGSADIVVERAAADALVAIPGSKLHLFDGLGHSPNLEAPDRFVAVLLASLTP